MILLLCCLTIVGSYKLFVKYNNKAPQNTHDYYIFFDNHKGETAHLLEKSGKLVYQWQRKLRPDKKKRGWDCSQLLPNGDIAAVVSSEGILRLDPYGNESWIRRGKVHHDVLLSENSNYFLLYEKDVQLAAVDAGKDLFVTDYIQEVDATGNIIWEWHFKDHVKEMINKHPEIRQRYTADDPQKIDFGHANAIIKLKGLPFKNDRRFKDGNILVNFFYIGLVVIVDKNSGEIVWSYAAEGHNGFHTPSFLPNGHLLLFRNKTFSGNSEITIIDPVSSNIDWEYNGGLLNRFYTPGRGSVYLTPHNTLLVFPSYEGRMFEITFEKEKTWELEVPEIRRILNSENFQQHARKKKKAPIWQTLDSYSPLKNFVGHRAYPLSKKYVETVLKEISKRNQSQ